MKRMSEFKIGDVVRIKSKNQSFEITWIMWDENGFNYSTKNLPWYRESQLCKDRVVDAEEELKIGDWVEVIGPCAPGYTHVSKRFEITRSRYGNQYTASGEAYYPASSLRKLSPDEIPCEEKPDHIKRVIITWISPRRLREKV